MIDRRRWLATVPLLVLGGRLNAAHTAKTLTVYTFGDSILDCAHYNRYRVHPGKLVVRNDLLGGLAGDRGPGMKTFETGLDAWLRALPIRPVLLGTVYDPTFGDDSRNFLPWDARIARTNHRRMNEIIASLATRYGKLADIHAHFLTGDPSWYVDTIEPSLKGASEVRRVFLSAL